MVKTTNQIVFLYHHADQWEIQDPELEVLHIRPCLMVMFPGVGLKNLTLWLII